MRVGKTEANGQGISSERERASELVSEQVSGWMREWGVEWLCMQVGKLGRDGERAGSRRGEKSWEAWRGGETQERKNMRGAEKAQNKWWKCIFWEETVTRKGVLPVLSCYCFITYSSFNPLNLLWSLSSKPVAKLPVTNLLHIQQFNIILHYIYHILKQYIRPIDLW